MPRKGFVLAIVLVLAGAWVAVPPHPGASRPGRAEQQGTFADLGDFVWYDTNHNGIQEAGEPGVAWVTVNLYRNHDCAGAPSAAADTDVAGAFMFTALPPGAYCMRFPLRFQWVFSPQNQGLSEALDSDADPATRIIRDITLETSNVDQDVGMYAVGAILGSVWCDADDNGAFENGEQVAGIAIGLWRDADCDLIPDFQLATATSNDQGVYAFPDLYIAPPGEVTCYVAAVADNPVGICTETVGDDRHAIPLTPASPLVWNADFLFVPADIPPIFLPLLCGGS
ncbi:MAG: hypothetical protein JXB35_12860 [Anaerolineae bacterium]|nr:hypothetical protein [Anaerolineae bacterium]